MVAKKRWVRPALVVLMRGKPEEQVLGACKMYPILNFGPSTTVTRCGVAGCGSCNAWAAS